MTSFDDFLIKRQYSNENFLLDYKTKDYLNKDNNDKTIFEIRYYKFNKIYEYKNDNKDVTFVNLSFLQKDNENVLNFLKEITFIKKNINSFNDDTVKN
jgi:hypothetical protein